MIAPRLESYRTAHGLTQRQMADRLGVSWRTYRGWINRPTGGPAVPLLERLLDEWEPVCVDCGVNRAHKPMARCKPCAEQYGEKC